MTVAAPKRWQGKPRQLMLEEVRDDHSFQYRVLGIDRAHANRLRKALGNGEVLPPIKVAQIGKALYLVDGFHRLAAHKAAGRATIAALVSRLSVAEAREEARLANTKHGKGLSGADKKALWEDFLANKGHLDARGVLKSSRTIEAEMGRVYSRETIRTKLKAVGLVLDEDVEYEGHYKPWGGDNADTLAEERALEAWTSLNHFEELFPSLEGADQRDLLVTVRELLGRLERGEGPERPTEDLAARLGI